MPVIDGVKYACASCIKGHRTSKCAHYDRPLSVVKKKGRPYSRDSRGEDHPRQEKSTSPSAATTPVSNEVPYRDQLPSPSSSKRQRPSIAPSTDYTHSLDGSLSPDVRAGASVAGGFASWQPAPPANAPTHTPLHEFVPSPPAFVGPATAPRSALFLPTTEGTSSCFCGDSCACTGCPLHDPLSLKQLPSSHKAPCQCTMVEKMISGQDAQCCSENAPPRHDCHSRSTAVA